MVRKRRKSLIKCGSIWRRMRGHKGHGEIKREKVDREKPGCGSPRVLLWFAFMVSFIAGIAGEAIVLILLFPIWTGKIVKQSNHSSFEYFPNKKVNKNKFPLLLYFLMNDMKYCKL